MCNLPGRLLLRLRYAQCDFVPVRRRDERSLFLCGSQAGENVPKGDGIGAHAEGGAPFFGDDFGEPSDAGFGESVVGLATVGWLALFVLGEEEGSYAFPLTPLVLLMLMMFLGSPSLTLK